MQIKKIAVIGSGVMGGAIAAHIANSGFEVVMLDIVPKDAEDRNIIAKSAIERMLKGDQFTHPKNAAHITPGNLEDNLGLLKDVDWVIEAALERLDIKHDIYKKVNANRKKGAVVSSNTSTIPLHQLIDGFDAEFQQDFMITHFFNPPRYMRLFELVTGDKTDKEKAAVIAKFADEKLGKGIVHGKDTPGFIANRIGCYWLELAVLHGMDIGISIEDADAVMGKPFGIPKTGVFGLMDLIGIDLMPLIAKAFLDTLPTSDDFCQIYKEPELIKKMIADGYTGRKGKGGFYRMEKIGEKKVKQSLNLKTGEYGAEIPSALASAKEKSLKSLMNHSDIGGQYALHVMVRTLWYAASLVPEISDDIQGIDDAMKLGYNWKYGPFELIDKIGDNKWIISHMPSIPPIMSKIGDSKFYDKGQFFNGSSYSKVRKESWSVADIKQQGKPIVSNDSASLWDVGDGVTCLEFTSKMNAIDPDILSLIRESIAITEKGYKAMIIGNDGDNFSVGANISLMLYAANIASWDVIEDMIKQGQETFMAMKYSPFPVVSALAGMALGGGCEVLLHSDAIIAAMESYPGLVELGVGVIPGWGGCKEMVIRNGTNKAFELIATAQVAKSADYAKDMGILNDKSRIIMNRTRVLDEAKKLALQMASGYKVAEKAKLKLAGESAAIALEMAVDGYVAQGKASPHDAVVAKKLAYVLTGGDADITKEISEDEMLLIERKAFMELVKMPESIARIEYMLNNGKPLKN